MWQPPGDLVLFSLDRAGRMSSLVEAGAARRVGYDAGPIIFTRPAPCP
ncbi:hypothetical protein RK21_01905 [Pseudomonas plecoglossicida]|nr:hypothetical protein RK21_01905 [Pseudomonas plecoglossicida]